MDDEAIIGLFWERSETAITAASEAYGPYCRTIAQNILADPRDAEECVNDTWLRAWNAMPPQRPSRLRLFLGKITRNLALNRYAARRTQKRGGGETALALHELEDCLPASGGPEQAVEAQLLTQALNAFLRAQPDQRRSIFLRRYWQLAPIREIARAWGMQESAVKSLLFRMRGALKAHLIEEGILE